MLPSRQCTEKCVKTLQGKELVWEVTGLLPLFLILAASETLSGRDLSHHLLSSPLFRSQLGPELEIVVLEMTLEEQMERIRGRHEGSENAVDMMKVK